ncbi:ABC transporter permease [Nocardioides sp. GXZ039]|uniref:ABC transporter permease n=1 Tax=Nocardioides sp. GXZ039 TaxID=3136018 RepID=UPI0030F469C9
MRPSFLAVRELTFARGRFLLMGAVVALIAMLMVLLSGLSVGLVNDGVSGLQRMPVTSFAFQHDAKKDAAFSRSIVNLEDAEAWADQPGVADAAPFGNTLVNGKTDRGVEIDLALFGVERDSFLDPGADEGEPLSADGQIVLAESATDEGVDLSDTVTLQPSGQELEVVGILEGQHTFGHVDVGYVTLPTWQQAKAGLGDGEPLPARAADEVTAIAVQAEDGADVDLAAGDKAADTTSMTLEDSFGASPGYTAETSTLQLIQGFLYLISALVVGAFFTVLTIQRSKELAVLRALGASRGYLLRESLLQSLVLLALSAAVGIGAGVALGAAIGATAMPFALEVGPIVGATILLLALGLAGAAIAVLRVTRIDPLAALGGSR